VSARCALTRYSLTQKIMRDNVNLYMKGVHSFRKVCIDRVYLNQKLREIT
jgi:hypothetical protein